ncbi:Dual-specificity RNA methyltransferase RlmN (23S rRNA (adenine(2503)-C(2))-methyltransferase) (23S rRNA m2A2503 methyltransferase) (Ribosomal RNA large subunit methyltransferase N) (tRNA (adenine(37)-C(2))-methyltransferase) (tRNA m2A37 methyltransferase), partial [Durusdinium trenchii]
LLPSWLSFGLPLLRQRQGDACAELAQLGHRGAGPCGAADFSRASGGLHGDG